MRKHHLVYKITNNINESYYYGIHSTRNLKDEYMGSGRYLLEEIKKYGIDNFTKKILFNFSTREEALNKERELVTQKEVENKNCYNMILGGGEFPSSKVNEKHIAHLSPHFNLEILKTYRRHYKISQQDLAQRIGISQEYLSLIELNKNVPAINVIENICKELNLELKIIPKA